MYVYIYIYVYTQEITASRWMPCRPEMAGTQLDIWEPGNMKHVLTTTTTTTTHSFHVSAFDIFVDIFYLNILLELLCDI